MRWSPAPPGLLLVAAEQLVLGSIDKFILSGVTVIPDEKSTVVSSRICIIETSVHSADSLHNEVKIYTPLV